MSMRQCRRFHISGKVQGVFFRASARAHAQGLGLAGWVLNLPDGRVEAVAAGKAAALAAFAQWLAHGPPHARVTTVTSTVCEEEVGSEFEIR